MRDVKIAEAMRAVVATMKKAGYRLDREQSNRQQECEPETLTEEIEG